MSVLEKISEYLQVGGFFNPELMEHDKVRDMILECRDEFKKLQEENKALKDRLETAQSIIEKYFNATGAEELAWIDDKYSRDFLNKIEKLK